MRGPTGRRVNRATPQLPAHLTKTYSVWSPIETHYRQATCAEVECAAWRGGWRTVVDEQTPLGARQAAYIRQTGVTDHLVASAAVALQGARRYTEHMEGPLTVFVFPAGTRCFTPHHVPSGRPELYVVRDGDWRGNPRRTPPRRHTRPEHWVEDFAEHQGRLSAAIEKG